MANLEIIDQKGKSAGNVDLNEEIFGIEPNESVVFDAIIRQRAGKRQGTSAVKNRSAVRGGGKKPYRQKGTGRARQGSTRAPQFVGGGVVFGPTTKRNYKFKLNKKVGKLALRSALSQKVIDSELTAIDNIAFDAPKTKSMVAVLKAFNEPRKTLLVVDEFDQNVVLSANNIPNLKVIEAKGINVYDILNCTNLMMTEKAIKTVEEALA